MLDIVKPGAVSDEVVMALNASAVHVRAQRHATHRLGLLKVRIRNARNPEHYLRQSETQHQPEEN
jgi:hypothetical protein